MRHDVTKNKLKEENDLTSGNLLKKLIFFSIPILLTQLLSMLFTTADLFTVSRFGEGSISVSAIGANNTIINLIICLFLGLSVGANIVCGNAKGKNDKVTAFRATQSSIVLAALSGIVIAVLATFIARPLLELINTTPDVIDKAETYLKTYLYGAPFMLIFNFGSSILRAYGDSKRPLYALLISGIFNLGLNIFFVAVLKMDVLGVAIATDIAQGCGAIAVLCFLAFDRTIFNNFSFRIKKLKLYKKETVDVLKLGVSAGLQSLIFNITNIVIQWGVNSFGTSAVTGSTIGSNIEGYQYYVLNSISVATMAMISQNNGAKKKENILKTLKYSMILELTVVSIVGLIIFLLKEPLVRIFVSDSDPNYNEILYYATCRINIISLTYCICGCMEVFSSYFRGLKYSLLPTIVTILGTAIFRLIFLFTLFNLEYFHTFLWLFASYPISWVLTCIIYLFFIKPYSKKAFKKFEIKEDTSEYDAVLERYQSKFIDKEK